MTVKTEEINQLIDEIFVYYGLGNIYRRTIRFIHIKFHFKVKLNPSFVLKYLRIISSSLKIDRISEDKCACSYRNIRDFINFYNYVYVLKLMFNYSLSLFSQLPLELYSIIISFIEITIYH